MIIAGAVNIVGSLLGAFVLFCGTYGLGFCCALFAIFPLIAGVFELINGIKANKGEPVPNIKPSPFSDWLQGVSSSILSLSSWKYWRW